MNCLCGNHTCPLVTKSLKWQKSLTTRSLCIWLFHIYAEPQTFDLHSKIKMEGRWSCSGRNWLPGLAWLGWSLASFFERSNFKGMHWLCTFLGQNGKEGHVYFRCEKSLGGNFPDSSNKVHIPWLEMKHRLGWAGPESLSSKRDVQWARSLGAFL